MIPGMQEFLNEFSSEKAWGEEGYLTDRGMIPMPDSERKQMRSDVKTLRNLEM
jgi:phosphate transport system substrate-binding protein